MYNPWHNTNLKTIMSSNNDSSIDLAVFGKRSASSSKAKLLSYFEFYFKIKFLDNNIWFEIVHQLETRIKLQ